MWRRVQRLKHATNLFIALEPVLLHLYEEAVEVALKFSELVFDLFFFLELLLSLNLACTGLSRLFLFLLGLELAYARLDELLD